MIRHLKNIQKKILILSTSFAFPLFLAMAGDLAIPDPIPAPTAAQIEAAAALEEEKSLAYAPKPFPTAHMEEILAGYHTGLDALEDTKLVAFISEASREYGFDPELILAVITTESSFYNWSISNKGAVGMMQIIPATGRALAKATQMTWNEQNKPLFDPYVNIRLGIHYLDRLNKRFGNLHTALAAYNFGPTKIRRWIRQGKKIPTRYADKVMRSYQSYLAINAKKIKRHTISTQAPSPIPERSDT